MSRLRVLWACFAVVVAALPGSVAADRITQMSREDRCAYAAKLHVLAAYWFAKGTPRPDVKIHWHGDETPFEIEFVNRTLDEGYAEVSRDAAAGRSSIPVEVYGDRAYEACMSRSES
jgi:hypothetical protein